MQVNRNENALIAPLPKTTSVHQSNHVQNVFAFHINQLVHNNSSTMHLRKIIR